MLAFRLFLVILVSLPLFSSVNSSASWLGELPADPIEPQPQSPTFEFTHGVASSEVTSANALLWTRVDQPAALTVQVSTDPDFATITFQKDVVTSAQTDFTARVSAGPLEAD